MEEAFRILGISKEASIPEIKRAYRRKAKLLHPDLNPDPAAREKFIRVQQAYDYLIDLKEGRIGFRPIYPNQNRPYQEAPVRPAQERAEAERKYREHLAKRREERIKERQEALRRNKRQQLSAMKASKQYGLIRTLFFLFTGALFASSTLMFVVPVWTFIHMDSASAVITLPLSLIGVHVFRRALRFYRLKQHLFVKSAS